MSSPQKQLAGLRVSKRERKSTPELLPTDFDLNSKDGTSPPKPESSQAGYTEERYQKSLVFAHKFLARRNISPGSEAFMKAFKDQVKDALQTETREEAVAVGQTVLVMETLIQKTSFLVPSSVENARLQTEIFRLRELEYFSRYGDYVKIIPTKLRIHFSQSDIENRELLSGKRLWTTIARDLLKEDDALAKAKNADEMQKVSLETANFLKKGCMDLGISPKLAKWSILTYAERNASLHRDLDVLRSTGKFPQLAAVLYQDLIDIDVIFPTDRSETDKEILRELITDEINHWFDTSPDPEEVLLWIPTPALLKSYKKEKESTTKEAIIAKSRAISEETVKKVGDGPKKRAASTERPMDPDVEQKKARTQAMLARRLKLESQIQAIDARLAKDGL